MSQWYPQTTVPPHPNRGDIVYDDEWNIKIWDGTQWLEMTRTREENIHSMPLTPAQQELQRQANRQNAIKELLLAHPELEKKDRFERIFHDEEED